MLCIFLHEDENVIIVKEIQWELTEKILFQEVWASFESLMKCATEFLKLLKLKKNSITALRLLKFLTLEKGLHHFFTTFKVIDAERELHHFLTTL